MRRILLTIAYDGSAYNGWSTRGVGRGVRAVVADALKTAGFPDPVLESASRTDAGVHALGMAAHFDVPDGGPEMADPRIVAVVNAKLPKDVRVVSAETKPAGFHARFDAVAKRYRYRIWNAPVMNPLLVSQAWHVPRPLDVDAMSRAAACFVGRHDFTAFTSRRKGVLGDPAREMFRCEVRRHGEEIAIDLEASGFLYKMCRAIAGTLTLAGHGRISDNQIRELLNGGSRHDAGMNAPAHGLVLLRVIYPDAQ
ncbi:MAG: tRNA pseudouridine(38-40) synthase TruA [Akkermansiaceae bacterium]|nr:tRNA pseudouridine(38-40) synthase TruA [Akkermansiaceae bacterium]